MFYLPLYHNLRDAKCLVVGAGTTAARKIHWLVRAQARIEIVAPEISDELRELEKKGLVTITQAEFVDEHITDDLVLIIAATNDPAVSLRVSQIAGQLNILVNCVDRPELCSVIFPAIVDRDPILIAISSMGSAPTLARIVRGWIETLLSPNLGRLADLGVALRERVKDQIVSLEARRSFWETLFGGHAAEQALQGNHDQAVVTAEKMLANPEIKTGSVALVGAGPGDPELITLKALRLLQRADVILYDKLANPALLDYARRDAQRIFVGKQGPKPGSQPDRSDNRSNQQQSINEQIISHAQAGKQVVRLKGGDPFIYGRGGEELESLVKADIDVIVVPGITAALGAASYAGIPLTYRNLSQSVRFVTGHRVENTVNLDWPEMGRADQTLVIYMGLVGLQRILQRLMQHGCEARRPAALIEHATLPAQRIIDGNVGNLAQLATEAQITGPCVVIIGEVVGLRHRS